MKIFENIAVAAAPILIPKETIDMKKWAVIACDQYTSEPEYWEAVEQGVKDSPSTLNLIYPEAFLEEDETKKADRLLSIKKTASEYLNGDIWNETEDGFIVLDRATSLHPSRKGLVISVDLEQYSYEKGNKERIRATEGTVLSRIPPRVKIRANSPIELPHIMLLLDDPNGNVIEKAWDAMITSSNKAIYDTDLWGQSGHIKGYFVDSNSEVFDGIIAAFKTLCEESKDGMLFAVGDGNHSLASAKAHWDSIKASLNDEQRKSHPARFALAEVVNIHDKGLEFEPIHRVVFGCDAASLIEEAKKFYADCSVSFTSEKCNNCDSLSCQCFTIVGNNMSDTNCILTKPKHSLAVGSVQMLLDSLVEKSNGAISVDYIHGEDSVRRLATAGNCGILLPNVSKNSFFGTIETEGVFPRKTFSMGEAFEKRFYIEAKRIV